MPNRRPHPPPATFHSPLKSRSRTDRVLRSLEGGLWTIGLTLLAIFFAFRISGFVGNRVAMWQLSSSVGHASEVERQADRDSARASAVERTDFRLWSQKRIEAYKQSLAAKFGSPLALLTIGRLSLQVPVFEGTGEPVLNRGVGRIAGTAKPGEAGNIGIAGHRDGFFRCLKDIAIGDRIELDAHGRKSTYTVDAIRVVNPEDVSVLLPRNRSALTLVTCYPFYFMGSAPQRFIVHASMTESNAEPGSIPVRTNQPTTNQHKGG